MRIAVVGTGYVGLVTATCLAESGNDVVGVDKDSQKVETLRAGRLPIYEPGLLELVQRNRRDGRLAITTDLARAVQNARYVFVCVGTPAQPDGLPDLAALWELADALAKILVPGQTVVLKSTVPVGTNRHCAERLRAHAGRVVEVVSNPEFLKEGAAVDDFMRPDRVVVGVRETPAAEGLRALYAPFLRTERPLLVMSPESAEMTKYTANAMLATKISFINEVANLCERLGADVNDVRRGIGHDGRIGFAFLFPGSGYGGSCLPKDVRALVALGQHSGADAPLLRSVELVNESQKLVLVDKVRRHYGEALAGKTLAVWGAAFKPRTDDVREAPALAVLDALLLQKVALRIHDPEALQNLKQRYGDRLIYCDRPYGALEGADGLIIATEWNEFRNPDFEIMKRLLRQPVIFDGRNLYDPDQVAQQGFRYYSIGRAPSGRL